MLSLGYLQHAQEFILQLLDQERSTVLAPVPHFQQRGQVVTRGQKEILKRKGFQDFFLNFRNRRVGGMEQGEPILQQIGKQKINFSCP